jgi:hypothetical protein
LLKAPVPVTVALNCRFPPFSTVAVAGLTVTPVTTGREVVPFSQDERTRTRAKASAQAPVRSLARSPMGGGGGRSLCYTRN